MQAKITRLAVPGKCGFLGARGLLVERDASGRAFAWVANPAKAM